MHASCCTTAASSAISTTAAALRSHTWKRFPGARRPHPVSKSSISPIQLRSGRGFSFQVPRAKVGRMEAARTPREVPAGMEDQEQLMTQLSSIPSISRAWLLPGPDGGTELRVELSQRDQPANKARSFACSSSLPSSWSPGEPASWSWPTEISDILSRSFSPSGNKMVVAKASSAPADSLALEIWSRGRLLSTTLVPKTLHGPLINDGYFATGFSWSHNEDRIAYTAEAPEEIKSKEFRSTLMARQATKAAGDEQPEAKAPSWRGVGPWEQDWGELNVGKRPPSLFVLALNDMSVRHVIGLPADTSCGQPVWEPSGRGLVFVGWPHKAENFPQSAIRLGVVYCYNRPCHLWSVSVPHDATTEPPPTAMCLTADLMSAQAPRFSPNGKKLIFLSWHSATATGVHNSTAALFCMDWEQEVGPAKELVGVVQEPLPDTGFPGIYAGFGSLLLDNPFLDDDTIILGSQWRSASAILKVNLSSGKVERLTPQGGDRPSYTLLAAQNGLLVAATSGPCAAHLVMVAKVDETTMAVPEWHPLPFEDDPAALLSGIEHHVLQVEPSLAGSSNLPFEAIVIRPSGAEPGPTVLMPHGGPHHAFLTTYVMPLAFLAHCGYTIVLVNFRGSTGFGEASVQSLPGHAGTQDVSDCMDALAASVAAGYSDQSAVAACGGSHGGFLTGHLVGQYPSAFRAGILRNPVLDLGLMIFCSDIPDWVYIEAWGQEEGMARFKPRPDATDLERFYEVSPIRYVDSVSAPLLFMLGAKDHRVTWNDARHYMATLQSRADAPDVQAWLFPEDSHALDRPQTEVEQWLNTAAWLKQYCNPP